MLLKDPNNPIHRYPRYQSGPDALLAFLKGTYETPTVGQTVFEFTIAARTERECDNFIQSMRSALSKQRDKFKRMNNRAPQKFTMKKISVHIEKKTGLALIALGRKQVGSTTGDTLGIEMMQLLSRDYTESNRGWGHMLRKLQELPEMEIDVSNWNETALAVIMVYQQNAVYKRFDEDKNCHVIGRV